MVFSFNNCLKTYEIHATPTQFLAFVRLSEAEVSLMKAILPEDDFKKVFDLIVNIPLDSIKQDAGRFVRHCKECKG